MALALSRNTGLGCFDMNSSPESNDDNESRPNKRLRVSPSFRESDVSASYRRAISNLPGVAAGWGSSGEMLSEKAHFDDEAKSASHSSGVSPPERARASEPRSEEKGDEEQTQRKGGTDKEIDLPNNFPGRLHHLLRNKRFQDIVCWAPDGESFAIKSRIRFVEEVLPQYYKESKFESFTRKLNRWRFRRISSNVFPDDTVYYNPLFKRDSPELCKQMSGAKKAAKKRTPSIGSQNPDTALGGVPIQAPGIAGLPTATHAGGVSHPSHLRVPQQAMMMPQAPILDRRLFEREIIAGQEADRMRRVQSLNAELEARQRALALLQPPLRSPALTNPTLLGGLYAGLSTDAAVFAQLQQRQRMLEEADAQALLLRQHQMEADSHFLSFLGQSDPDAQEPPPSDRSQSEDHFRPWQSRGHR